ncbi:MAG: 50S ribosomal protein L23 [Opitutales bacterium]
MTRHPDKILKELRVTEKSTNLQAEENKFTFEIFPDATRTEVAEAVQELFNVRVAKVNILRQMGKIKRNRVQRGSYGRKRHEKRAIVTLAAGETIDLA